MESKTLLPLGFPRTDSRKQCNSKCGGNIPHRFHLDSARLTMCILSRGGKEVTKVFYMVELKHRYTLGTGLRSNFGRCDIVIYDTP